jgi:hypothetical protein
VEVKSSGLYALLAVTDFERFVLKEGDVIVFADAGVVVLRKNGDVPNSFFESMLPQVQQMQPQNIGLGVSK